jgi:hypothetical protein
MRRDPSGSLGPKAMLCVVVVKLIKVVFDDEL